MEDITLGSEALSQHVGPREMILSIFYYTPPHMETRYCLGQEIKPRILYMDHHFITLIIYNKLP